ncbi:MAG: response regulator [Gemmatimonadaceae bacterium]
MKPVKVVVADDHAVVRAGIVHIFGTGEGYAVVGEASTADDALALVIKHRPDVVVLDVSMPGRSGISLIPEIRRYTPATKILMLSMYDNPEYVAESERAGADGYVLKDLAATALRTAAAAVLRGERAFPAPGSAPDNLTPRERQVISRIARGLTTKEIAAELEIGPRTVDTYRENIARKVGISTVAGLTRYVIEHRITAE